MEISARNILAGKIIAVKKGPTPPDNINRADPANPRPPST
jgi:hypothetical protein